MTCAYRFAGFAKAGEAKRDGSSVPNSSASSGLVGRRAEPRQEALDRHRCLASRLGLVFLTIGVAKLTGTLNTVERFEDFGWDQWFRYATGGLDIAGALLVFVPRWTFYGALVVTWTIGLAAVLSFTRPIDFFPAASFVLLAATLAWLTRPRQLPAADVIG